MLLAWTGREVWEGAEASVMETSTTNILASSVVKGIKDGYVGRDGFVISINHTIKGPAFGAKFNKVVASRLGEITENTDNGVVTGSGFTKFGAMVTVVRVKV